VTCSGIGHRYLVDGSEVVALHRVDLAIEPGSSTAIVGSSGSGKSTLLTLLAGLQRPTEGTIRVGATDITALDERSLLRLRATRLAVTPQNPDRNLLPYATAIGNVLFAQRGPRSHGRTELPDAAELLAELGLRHVAETRCDRLSGGERQRLALATALATDPTVLLADEPTSQLDQGNRRAVARLLAGASRDRGITVLAVTHDHDLAEQLDRSVRIADGRLEPADAEQL
jgi:ABC-type lipoprotein export system ATPase subunit